MTAGNSRNLEKIEQRLWRTFAVLQIPGISHRHCLLINYNEVLCSRMRTHVMFHAHGVECIGTRD